MVAVPKMAPRIDSPKHVKFLHQLVCVICGAPEVHVHHLRRGLTRRGQYRAGDNEGLPLCPCHHNMGDESLHGRERFGEQEMEYLAARGIADPIGLTAALFANTGNYDACMDIIAAARTTFRR